MLSKLNYCNDDDGNQDDDNELKLESQMKNVVCTLKKKYEITIESEDVPVFV